ncbi:MAG: AAA family ATPase [Patescibacteria group bacterium]|jgi:ATP-dependent Clp protease ATP-binding subunit ClpC
MEKDSKKNQIQLLTCPTCQGQGKLERKTCSECQGLGMMAWTGNELLYWDKQISFLQIAQDETKQLVKNLINLSLFLFGALGLIMLGWVIVAFINVRTPIWYLYQIRNWQLFIFWLSLLTDGYLVYRFNRELEKIKYIPKKEYHAQTLDFRPLGWIEAKNLPKNKKINITEYFTFEAEQAITKSWQLTNRYKDFQTNPIHLFISLLTFDQTQIIFSRLGVSFTTLKNKIRNTLAAQYEQEGAAVILSHQVKEIIFQAYFLAFQLRQKKVELTELLEALVSPDNEVKELLYDLNVTSDKITNVIAWLRIRKQLKANWQHFRKRASLRPRSTMNRSMTAIATPTLDAFSQDLTILAQYGYLLPCVGREKEIESIFNIMRGGGTRSSAILVGNPGVGKNTIIEGIAQRMVEENVPGFLKDKRLVSLSVAKLVSGASPEEAQQRLMLVINEIRRSGNIILYVSDIHNMIGITPGRKGSIDLADVLSQTLANNSLMCLATTTPPDYRRYIEGKSSLDNVLEKVDINEVSGNEAIQILESKVGTFEYQSQIFFSYDAIAQIVELSDRYLHDRFLPEKAIEILQEVAGHTREQKGKNSVVTANDVALIISAKTNIPLSEITKEESEKLLNLEQKIHERVVDQQEAVDMVASSLRRARAEMRDKARPIVNLLFLGPTGVGKTELAKTVAAVYFGAEENMIRLDMSEYQEKPSISRLIGAPAGSGSDNEGGYLSEAVRKNPFSLILLDEIEKAHPDILNIFLQIMDDGRLTDNSGRTIDFTNTIIIATSNANTKFIQEKVKQNIPIEEIKKQLMDQELNQYFRPEFLNRFDGIIVFKPLSMDDVKTIAQLMINKVAKNLAEKGVGLKVTDQAIAELAEAGFDPQFGARPLRRVIQQRIQDPLANSFLAGQIGRRDTIVLEAGGRIVIEKAKVI